MCGSVLGIDSAKLGLQPVQLPPQALQLLLAVAAALLAALASEAVHRAYAAITLPNAASVALHERFGFEPVGIFHEVGHKQGRYWDVGWYEKAVGPGVGG